MIFKSDNEMQLTFYRYLVHNISCCGLYLIALKGKLNDIEIVFNVIRN
jgi:hypothetical protein